MKPRICFRTRAFWVSVLLCIGCTLKNIYAQPSFSVDGSMSGKCYSIEILESTTSRFKVHIQIHRINNQDIVVSDTLYHLLYFENPMANGNYGCPAFPTISQLVAIPDGCSFHSSLTEDNWEDIYVGMVFPVQQPRFEDDSTEMIFSKSSFVYNSTSYSPEIVSISDEMIYRDVRNVAVNICPFKYSPSEGVVSVLKEFTLQIDFDRVNALNSVAVRHSLMPSLFANGNILSSETLEHQSVGGTRSFPNYEYLIIVGDIEGATMSSCISRFRRWKAYKGLNTKMVSTSETGTTANNIKSYIANEYLLNPNLKYVLFIGDVDKIPMKTLWSPSSHRHDYISGDYWYGCMDDNDEYQADIAIGRFPTNDTLELTNMIDKTIRYEREQRTFNKDVLLIAAQYDTYNMYDFRACAELIRQASYSTAFSTDTIYGSSYSYPLNSDIVEGINSNENIVNYRGHGWEKYWVAWSGSQYFSDSYINNLGDDVNSVFFSIACNTGKINYIHPCMLETFLRSNHGAVSFLGATMPSIHSGNDTFNSFLFSCLYNGEKYNLGDLVRTAHIQNITYQTNDSIRDLNRDNALIYICGGDPSLEIWTGQPQVFNNLTFTPTSDGQLMLNTNMTEDVLVHVVSEYGEKFWTVPISSSGILPSYGNVCYYAINRHNYIPYILRVDFTSNTIQNMTFTDNNLYMATPISICSPTIVKEGSSLQLNVNNGVTINDGFSVEKGGQLLIK